MTVKEVTWVIIKLYALYEILSGIRSLLIALMINTQLHPSDYTAISCYWPGLQDFAIGLLLLVKTGLVLELIYGGWDDKVNGQPSSNQATQATAGSASGAPSAAPEG
ncbi:MAG: hypothetical protein NTV22_18300 [bacterium]|nr:hypothetical protein [bacterium]